MLTRQEELDLFEEMKTSERAREKFFIEKTHLVRKIVWQFCGTTDDDYMQQGFLGLMRAIELFDPSQGFRFNTYAKRWVFAKIQNYSNKNRVVRYGKRELLQRRQQGLDSVIPCVSLDYTSSEGLSLLDLLEDDTDVLEDLIKAEEIAFVKEELSNISDPRAKDMVFAHFGVDQEDQSYRTLGKSYGVSGERVRQIVQKQLGKMKANYEDANYTCTDA